GKQNSAYGPTAHLSMTSPSKPYPPQWEQVADLRVFRTPTREWEKLIGGRADMGKRGWKLLRVASEGTEMVAVFGRTKGDRAPASGTAKGGHRDSSAGARGGGARR